MVDDAVNIALLICHWMDVCQQATLLLPVPADLRAAQAGAQRGRPVKHELLMPACAPLCRGGCQPANTLCMGSTTCNHRCLIFQWLRYDFAEGEGHCVSPSCQAALTAKLHARLRERSIFKLHNGSLQDSLHSTACVAEGGVHCGMPEGGAGLPWDPAALPSAGA